MSKHAMPGAISSLAASLLLTNSVIFPMTATATVVDSQVIAAEQIQWGMLNPARGEASPRAADLWGDRTQNTATGMLVKFQKGFSSPPHIHNISYRGIVIEGLMHNDDPDAAPMWLPAGSFWTQPAGEAHITAAAGQDNMIYLEIDSGPYLVKPTSEAFDNGERPINVAPGNLVWLTPNDTKWVQHNGAQISWLWGNTHAANGSFIKIPAGSKVSINASNPLKAVVVSGMAEYQLSGSSQTQALSPASYFSSESKASHNLRAKNQVILYIRADGKYLVEQ